MNATQVTINVKGKDDTISLDRLAKCLDNFDASQIPIPGTGNVPANPGPYVKRMHLWAIHNEYGMIAVAPGVDECDALDNAIEADACACLACDDEHVSSLSDDERDALYCVDGEYFDLTHAGVLALVWEEQCAATQIVIAYLVGKRS